MKTITTHLQPYDDEIVRRAAKNLTDFQAGKDSGRTNFYPEYAGVFSVNIEELLEVIERLSQASASLPTGEPGTGGNPRASVQATPGDGQTGSVHLASCGHPADEDGECGCAYWPERAPVFVEFPPADAYMAGEGYRGP